jgi:hypothetical protein
MEEKGVVCEDEIEMSDRARERRETRERPRMKKRNVCTKFYNVKARRSGT